MRPRVSAALFLALTCTASSATAQFTAFTANSCSSDVSIIDVAARTVTATVAVDGRPKGVAVTPDGEFAYVVDAGADQVWVIDAKKLKIAKTIRLGDYAGEHNLQSIAMSPDGAFAYVPRADAKTLAVIDTKTRRVAATIPLGDVPEGLVIDSTGAFAYVGIGAQWVAVVDLASRQVVARVDLGFSKLGPTDLAVLPGGEIVYVATQDWYVKALDPQTNTLLTTLTTASGDVFGLAVTPDGSRLYATEFFAPAVLVVDTDTNLLVTSIPLTSRPRDIAITPDGALALVTGEQNLSPTGNDVTVIDVASNTVAGAIPVGCGPAAYQSAIVAAGGGRPDHESDSGTLPGRAVGGMTLAIDESLMTNDENPFSTLGAESSADF